MKYIQSLLTITSLSLLMSSAVIAKTIEVDAVGTAFQPMVVFAKAGDQVSFQNMMGHMTTTVFSQKKGGTVEYIPAGAEGWTSELGEDFVTPKLKQGVYFYKCTPHYGLGMAGSIVVDEPTNFAAIKNSKPHGFLHILIDKTDKAIKAKATE